jgi:hypothetical protein
VIFQLALYLIIKLLLLLFSLGIGYLLHRWLPGIDLGSGTLIGLIATIAAIHFSSNLSRLMGRVKEVVLEEEMRAILQEKLDSSGAILRPRPIKSRKSRRKPKVIDFPHDESTK